ncbi:MAG: 50S ribosomal protein L9 [Patescibacteria group bacterium]
MKVILLKDVAKVGQHGTIQEVSDGYALNFLIARGLAIQATPEKVAAHAAAAKREGDARELAQRALTSAIQSVEGARITIFARATEKGGLFRSIVAGDIVKALSEQKGARIPEEAIVLPRPIKQTGEHTVVVQSGEIKAEIALAIIANA